VATTIFHIRGPDTKVTGVEEAHVVKGIPT
jgi:hypothetical protein